LHLVGDLSEVTEILMTMVKCMRNEEMDSDISDTLQLHNFALDNI